MVTTARVPATGLALLVLASVAIASGPDFAELNASQWNTFASDGAAAGVEDSTTRIKDGSASILFTTASGFDTGVRYPAAADLNFDASAYNYLVFWEYAENTTPIGFQGEQPIVMLKSPGGSYTFTPDQQLTPNFAWRLMKMPLAGGNGWTRTATGSPSLADVDQIEIHHDTWDAGFRVFIDGVRFMTLDPSGLPPAGPTPPPGVDPDIVESKALLYIYNPIMTNFGGQRMTTVYGWGDPVTLTNQVIQDLLASSHGRARYQIVETIDDTTFPYLEGGFQYTPASFHQAWTTHQFQPGTFDYTRFVSDHGLGARVDAGEIDEVWVYAFPGGGMWESAMAGSGAYWINGTPYPTAGGQRAFPIMGWNFERGVGEAIHSFGHRVENTMVHMYGQWLPNRNTTWNRFSLLDRDAPGLGGVGNVHFPVNAQSDYDYANPRFVQSNADAWLSYPNLNDATRSFNFHEWSPIGADPQREYLNWWYQHMPHVPGRAPDGWLGNWWRYLVDLDQFKATNGNLVLTIGIPSVHTVAPADNAQVSGVVHVRADAEVDGALGRVDFYIDGVYRDSDYLGPYTLEWDTSGLSGAHTLVAKAYELQNGTEGVAPAVTVSVVPPPPCAGDANGDRVINGADLSVLLGQFSQHVAPGTGADLNGDGVVNGADLSVLLGRFGSSC